MQPCRIDNLAPSNFYNVQAAQSRILQFENLLHQLGDEAVCPIYKYLQARNRLPPAWQPLQSSVALLTSNKANDANGSTKGDGQTQLRGIDRHDRVFGNVWRKRRLNALLLAWLSRLHGFFFVVSG